MIGTALVVQPLPTYHGKNVIHIAQVPDASADGGAVIQVSVNGELDSTQPGISDINRIIVFGGRTARNQIVVDPSVQVATTIDSGHGKRSFPDRRGGPDHGNTAGSATHVDRRAWPEPAHRPGRQRQVQTQQGDHPDLRQPTEEPDTPAESATAGRNVLPVCPRASGADPAKRREGKAAPEPINTDNRQQRNSRWIRYPLTPVLPG